MHTQQSITFEKSSEVDTDPDDDGEVAPLEVRPYDIIRHCELSEIR